MNINVENSNLPEIARPGSRPEMKGTAAVSIQETAGQRAVDEAGRITSVQQTAKVTYHPGESQTEKIQQDAQQLMEEEIFRKQMDIISGTMSGKDCEELEKDGFSVNGTEVETIVTEIDKIKMELAKAGVDITTFGDGLSGEQLEKLAGNPELAGQLEAVLKQADLPVTQETVSGCEEAIEQASGLTGCSDEVVKYMLEHELEPTVDNLYRAQHSTAAAGRNPAPIALDDHLRAQVEEIITQAGLPVNEETMARSQWMLENQLSLTGENLRYAMDLNHMELPPDMEQLAGAMAEAVAEGNRPVDAVILAGYGNRDRAEQAVQTVNQATDAEIWNVVDKGLPLTIENLQAEQNGAQQENSHSGQNTARQNLPDYAQEELSFLTAKRQLEETRLMMTAQANYALLKQGISIETQPLEELVAQLKSLEDEYYRNLLARNGIPATEENTAVFADTITKSRELAGAPAYILGTVRTGEDTVTSMHQAGTARQAELERAGEAYETLRTAPRADLGDSIRKAFRNVDDILQDLNLETTEQNRRAVRILAYNQMEINEESIAGMKAADQKVQNLFQNLSPSVVMEMIREGVNPLEMNVEQLNSKAQEIRNRMEDAGEEKFSKYLWKLEQRQEISPQERDSYIGIYRLLRQIDKTDGAVIGALVHQGAELSMKNLLSAVRTNRNSGIDASVDDSFGEADVVGSQELSISQQIEAAYQTDCAREAFGKITPEGMQQAMAEGSMEQMTPEELLWQLREAPVDQEAEEAWYQEQMREFSSARQAEDQVLQLLKGHDMPMTAYNIMAAGQMIHNRNGIFKTLFDYKNSDKEVNFEEIKEGILEDFAEAVKTPEEMAEAQEKLADLAENVMKTMIESEPVGSMDIRDMKILRQQIELGTRMSKEENYAIPVLVADELTNVQLKIVRGKEERGMVDIMFESPTLGNVAAKFKVQQDSVKGYVVSDSPRTIEELKNRQAELREQINPGGEAAWNLDLIYSEQVELSRFSTEEQGVTKAEQSEEAWQVQTGTLYGIAKTFLEEVKQMGQKM